MDGWSIERSYIYSLCKKQLFFWTCEQVLEIVERVSICNFHELTWLFRDFKLQTLDSEFVIGDFFSSVFFVFCTLSSYTVLFDFWQRMILNFQPSKTREIKYSTKTVKIHLSKLMAKVLIRDQKSYDK